MHGSLGRIPPVSSGRAPAGERKGRTKNCGCLMERRQREVEAVVFEDGGREYSKLFLGDICLEVLQEKEVLFTEGHQ